jgi:hypothetical protein
MQVTWPSLILLALLRAGLAQDLTPLRHEIPKVWNEGGLRDQELLLVVPRYSPKPVPVDYYYKIPVRTIYKSYPIYAPGRELLGYFDNLKTLEPEITFDSGKLKTKEDWIRAGELVFDAPTLFNDDFMPPDLPRDPGWYKHTGVRLTQDGIMPYARYVVREKGKVEVGSLSCSMCHTRVLENGTVIKGGPGNFSFDKTISYRARQQSLEQNRLIFRGLFWIPWVPERERQFESYNTQLDSGSSAILVKAGGGFAKPLTRIFLCHAAW